MSETYRNPIDIRPNFANFHTAQLLRFCERLHSRKLTIEVLEDIASMYRAGALKNEAMVTAENDIHKLKTEEDEEYGLIHTSVSGHVGRIAIELSPTSDFDLNPTSVASIAGRLAMIARHLKESALPIILQEKPQLQIIPGGKE